MNFSKRGTVKKQKKIKSTSRKLTTKAGVCAFRVFLVCLVIIAVTGIFSLFGVFKGIIDNAPDIDSVADIIEPKGFPSIIYDQKGNEIQKLIGSDANRIYRELDQIPLHVQNAFIAIEDERFWEHSGIDIKGIFRAFIVGLAKGKFSQGASTLTQQLLKNQVFEGGSEDNFLLRLERKIQEQYLAVQLEDRLSKKQILEYYLNMINLGQNTLGVQAASKRYFNKDVKDLTISECTVIAGITKNPVALNPITHPDKNEPRRLDVLDKMKELNYITEDEYAAAIADTKSVYKRIQTVNSEIGGSSVYSYFVDETINQVMRDLQTQKGYTQTQASNAIYTGGLSIYTTQDTKLQTICDTVLNDDSLYPSDTKWELNYQLSILEKDGTTSNYSAGHLKLYFLDKNSNFSLLFNNKKDANPYIKEFKKYKLKKGGTVTGEKISFTIQPQISFVLMDQATGQVKSIVGGRGKKQGNRTLNRATGTVRQPGSTFKILCTYLPALESGNMTLASVQDDAPYTYPNGERVNNWNRNSYKGLVTLRDGIINSMNIVTVKTLAQITPNVGFNYLKNLGFTTIVESRVDDNGSIHSDINLPMALGGLTDGVYNLELTAAFAAIANKGVYIEPSFYTKIVDHDGKVLIEKKPEKRRVIKEPTAWLLTNAMEDVVKYGTGTKARLTSVNMPVAGKTGTTTNDNDLWFSGYTPYYTATIWGGFDNNGKQYNTSYHKILWKTIMEKIHAGRKTKSFKMPSSIVTARICTKSGKLAVDGLCTNAPGGSTVRTEYFARGTVPTKKCDAHVKLSICKASGRLASEFCPKEDVREAVYITKEPESGATKDTPYLLPKGLENSICNIHTSLSIPEKEPEEPKEPENPEIDGEDPTFPPGTTQDPEEDSSSPVPPSDDINTEDNSENNQESELQ